MTASLACAVHCALTPLLLMLAPLVGLKFLADERIEWGLVALSFALGSGSLLWSFRVHRRITALLLLAFGFTLLLTGRLGEEKEGLEKSAVPLVFFGGITIAAAHGVNRRLCHSCRVCSPDKEKTTPCVQNPKDLPCP